MENILQFFISRVLQEDEIGWPNALMVVLWEQAANGHWLAGYANLES